MSDTTEKSICAMCNDPRALKNSSVKLAINYFLKFPDKKYSNFKIVLYPESNEKHQQFIDDMLEKHDIYNKGDASTKWRFASLTHDHDEDFWGNKKNHNHALLNVAYRVSSSCVKGCCYTWADMLDKLKKYDLDSPYLVVPVIEHQKEWAIYISHCFQKNKYQYDINLLFGNDDEFIAKLIDYVLDAVDTHIFRRMYDTSNEYLDEYLKKNEYVNVRTFDNFLESCGFSVEAIKKYSSYFHGWVKSHNDTVNRNTNDKIRLVKIVQ